MPGPGAYWIGQEEIDEVMDVLSSGHLSRYGSLEDSHFQHKVYSLEQEFARQAGVKHCVATSSGTSALMLPLLAMDIRRGDEVIVPGYTFVASYSAVIFAGGVPVVAEIDDSLTLDPADVEGRITERTRFIMPVHMLGNPCDMERILAIARRYNLRVLEDCCQANGARYKGRAVGAWGDMGGFSLNVYKTITAGDGGLIVTDDDALYARAFALHDQGHSPNRAGLEIGQRAILGLNFRINELTGAVALAQLRKMAAITATLREKKRRFREAIGELRGARWRRLNDPEGECGTLLTVIFDEPERAARVARALGTKTVDQSGWHVYANMEHFMDWLEQEGRPHGRGLLPRTDDLLARSINLSVGVVDPGLGAGFGININSSDDEIGEAARRFRQATG